MEDEMKLRMLETRPATSASPDNGTVMADEKPPPEFMSALVTGTTAVTTTTPN
jgi:hypothetical protein